MNKFKKIGLTALATSLVASSAYAAEVSVSGAAGVTWKTQSGTSGAAVDHGKGIGSDNSLSFSASGEMDNGWTVSAATAFNDAGGISSNSVTLTMGSLGSLAWGHSMAGNAGNYDGLGGAYEEVDDGAATSLSTNSIGSTVDEGGIFYTSPSLDAGGMAATVHVGYTPRVTGANITGGGANAISDMGSGTNVGITLSSDAGLTAGVFANTVDRNTATGQDTFQGTWYATYAMGPIAFGYQQSYVENGVAGAAQLAASTKTFAAATGRFEADQFSITMNVNDNFSVSYAAASYSSSASA
jgi:outer membrane protein OmpU